MRFHCGISFSWKSIKKFIFPFIIGFLAYFFSNGFTLGFIKVNAYSNMSTSFNFDIPNYDEILDNYTCGTENVKDFFHNYIDNLDVSNLNYRLFMRLGTNNDEFRIYVLPKLSSGSRDRVNFYLQNHNGTYRSVLTRVFANTIKAYYEFRLDFENCDSNISTSQSWLAYLNYVNSGTYTYTTDTNGDFLKKSNDSQVPIVYQNVGTTTPNNNEDFDIIDNTNWFYYSSVQLNFNQDSLSNSTTLYEKSLHINNTNTTYQKTDNIPSFYDIKDTFPTGTPSVFLDYKTRLGTIYSNFTPSQLSNLAFRVKFNTDINSLIYYQNIDFNSWACYGRINHNDNYFSYVRFSYCDFETDFTSNDNSLVDFTIDNFNIYDSNDNVITDFSSYDKLYFYLDFSYKNDDLDKVLSNFSLSSLSNLYYTDFYQGPIYDDFDNLMRTFKMFVSTNKNQDVKFSVLNTSHSFLNTLSVLYAQKYNISTQQPIGSIENISSSNNHTYDFTINNSYSTGYMIYHDITSSNTGIATPSLSLFHFGDIIISFNTLPNFYYYDDTGTITNNDFIYNYDNFSTDDDVYDLSYYLFQVSDYIDGYSSKTYELSLVIQSFYDDLPFALQSTINVLFILFCYLFIFKEIRR